MKFMSTLCQTSIADEGSLDLAFTWGQNEASYLHNPSTSQAALPPGEQSYPHGSAMMTGWSSLPTDYRHITSGCLLTGTVAWPQLGRLTSFASTKVPGSWNGYSNDSVTNKQIFELVRATLSPITTHPHVSGVIAANRGNKTAAISFVIFYVSDDVYKLVRVKRLRAPM